MVLPREPVVFVNEKFPRTVVLVVSARQEALSAPSSLEPQRYGVPPILLIPVKLKIFFAQPKP